MAAIYIKTKFLKEIFDDKTVYYRIIQNTDLLG